MSSFLHVECHFGFFGLENSKAKITSETFSLNYIALIDSYKTDNRQFNSSAFVSHIIEHNQKLCYSGFNAHNNNGAADSALSQ